MRPSQRLVDLHLRNAADKCQLACIWGVRKRIGLVYANDWLTLAGWVRAYPTPRPALYTSRGHRVRYCRQLISEMPHVEALERLDKRVLRAEIGR